MFLLVEYFKFTVFTHLFATLCALITMVSLAVVRTSQANYAFKSAKRDSNSRRHLLIRAYSDGPLGRSRPLRA